MSENGKLQTLKIKAVDTAGKQWKINFINY